MSEPADASMMKVVPMSPKGSRQPEDAFADLFAATYPQIVRTVWFVIHDRAAAEEVAQDAFTELFRGWSRLRDYDRPELWVRRVAIRKAQREASRRGRRATVERSASTTPLVEDGIHLPDPGLIAAIRTLPAKQRAIVVLFYFEDRPMAEVADLVGCSTATGSCNSTRPANDWPRHSVKRWTAMSIEQRIREGLRTTSDELPVPDIESALATVTAEGRRMTRLGNGALVGLAAAAAVVAMIVGPALVSDDNTNSQPPPPLDQTTEPTEPTTEGAEWPGAVRSGALPVVSDRQFGPDSDPWRAWSDPHDSEVGQVDIRLLAGWGLQLREDSQLETWLEDEGRIVEYGIVMDTDGDLVADCQLALNTNTPAPGDVVFRMVLTNLDTGESDNRANGSYGYPFEFGFPENSRPFTKGASLYLEFLGEWQEPCAPPTDRLRWYAYASLTVDGQVTAWDFAPDEAWLQTLPRLRVDLGGRLGGAGWGAGLPLPREP